MVSSGPLTGSPRYSPVYRRPSLKPNVALQIEASPPAGEISSSSSSEKYDLSKKAYVLVLHHYKFKNKDHNRSGSMKDMEQIEKVLSDFRTDALKIHSNLSLLSVRQAMDGVSTKDFSKNSCLIVFIMSHGYTHDTIMAYDGDMYSFHNDVVEKCTMNATLKGKPKIFVIQACRGGAEIQTDSTRKIISDKKDIVTFQSTYEGTVSYRNEKTGTFFMQHFLSLLKSCDRTLDIHEINMRLNNDFTKNRITQTPTMFTTLQKRLILGDLRKSRS
ncbi:caspase b-like [Anopheles ziemanni]|nr:caspase b-like [Anopheles ziemanni]